MITPMEPSHFESLFPAQTRQTEIEQILGFVKSGNSVQVIGLPGGGKSHVLGLLPYNSALRHKHLGENQKWFHFVLMDFSQVRNKSLHEVVKFIFLSLIDSLSERKMQKEYDKAQAIFTQALALSDELVLFQGLKRAIDLLSIEKELTIVLLFDRFEEYIPMVTPEFFANLRTLRNHAKYRFSVVFSLNRPLEDLLDQAVLADFYDFLIGNVVYVSLFDKSGFVFRTAYMEKVSGKKLPPGALEEIKKLTGGHGKLTRLITESMLAHPNEKIEMEYLLKQPAMSAALMELWQYLTPSERHALATAENDPFLEKVGLLQNGKGKIPLFARFVKNRIHQIPTEDQFVYDPQINDIFRGELSFSDKLTASEFKLLRFLLQNRDKVVERDEIIQAVWKDAKSTAGVTDAAIDQLVFRLRKKIEDDPNNPVFLQTLKGRGIKFVK